MNKWIRHRSVGYMCGKGLTFGVGPEEFLPRAAVAPGVYSIEMDIVNHPRVDICDTRLDTIAEGSLDWVMVGERLGYVEHALEFVKALALRLKPRGHMIIAQPLGLDGPYVKTRFTPDLIRQWVAEIGSWQTKADVERGGWGLQVYKKLLGRRGLVPMRVSNKPRACVVRYGAMGDMIMVSPLIRRLAEDGYEVTINATPYSLGMLENNPWVGNIIRQEREAVPNADLGEYWDEWRPEYDRYINLSESIEGRLLKVEGRREFYTHKDWRHTRCNKNYYEFTMEMGGYPECGPVRGELYLSKDEERGAQQFVKDLQAEFVVMWALNGTSKHKVYPMMEPVLTEWLERHPKAKAITVGDYAARLMEFEHPQVVPMAGQWDIRTSVALTKYVNLVIGPESVIINSSGCWDTPKIPLLSHSTHENLCKHFVNDYCLAPSVERAPCYPCHQLHYTMESCPKGIIQIGEDPEARAEGPLCAMGAIEPERVMERMDEVYANRDS